MAALIELQKTKQVKYGLEVPSGLTYQGWEPGGEYTKPFILKNVNLKTQKVKYKISSNQFSSAIYPQPIVLSAGTSYTLPITFRPSEKCLYEEFIQIETGEGVFKIPILAKLPKADISLPHSLKFGMTAVQDKLTVHFELSNIGNVTADYTWEVPEGFTISPVSGSLSPKQSSKLTATFTPCLASVYSGEAVCNFTATRLGELKREGKTLEQAGAPACERRVMILEGIGKFPHVAVRNTTGPCKLPPTSNKKRGSKLKGASKKSIQDKLATTEHKPIQSVENEKVKHDGMRDVTVEFGCVPVGTVAEKWIEVSNVSPVSLTFEVCPDGSQPQDFIPFFTCSEFEGSLQPHESKKIKLLYSPGTITPHTSTGYFTVRAVGGLGKSTVVCSGRPVGPCVRIEQVVNFGNVELGKSVTKILHIRNESNAAANFQFQLDCGSVFQCNPYSGELGPHASKSLTLTFTPTKAIPYCRHVPVLVHHQEPLSVSFIGTCYSETRRPANIQPHHLSTYLQHAQSGLSKLSPEQLKGYLEDGQLSVEGGALVPNSNLTLPIPGTPLTPHGCTHAHYLQSQHEPSTLPHVSSDVNVLSFGYCAPQRTSDGKMVSITNHTEGTMSCVWMNETDSNSGSFSVTPEERFIQPGTTACFTVTFSPDTASQFYSKEIECYLFYKGLQDYRSIDPYTVTPPWCVTVRASGHTFAPGTETFQPRLKVDNKNIVFPGSVAGQPVYRTVLLSNEGDTPILYDIQQDQQSAFSVKPSHGLIRDSQLLVLQLLPSERSVYKEILTCQLNATQLWNEKLLLSGSGEAPTITLDNEGELFFKPTCVGASSSVQYSVTNTSRLPVRFSWQFEDTGNTVVRVEPSTGSILPHQAQKHTWYFTPTKCEQYSLKAVLQTTTQTLEPRPAPQTRNRSVVNVHGLGTLGVIKCSPDAVDCGTVIIGTSSQHCLTLSNPSPCSLHYRLSVDCQTSSALSPVKQEIVEVRPHEGVLPACTNQSVSLTVRPATSEQYTCIVKYHLIGSTTKEMESAPKFDLCTLRVDGAYPCLEIVDIQGVDVANVHSKANLWNMLNIDKVNLSLTDEPSAAELRYAIATRHSMRRRVPVRTRAIVDFDLGAAPLNAGCSEVHIMMENKGQVPTQWAFQFPTDMHLEPEYWAESGQLDDVEKHELNIVDNELFTIEPKRGSLEPGTVTTVIASFKHTHIGISKLPVLLKINRGREILLNWTGVTVEPGQSDVHFTTHSHTFNPVPIGLQAYPRQVYTLHNVGEIGVSYEIDTRPLEALRQSNYCMTVLECLQPKGTIPPLSSVAVEFVFSPMEAKRYTVDLPVYFSSGDTVFINFTGEGLDLSQPPLVKEHTSSPVKKVPVYGSISIPGQVAKLSQQTMSFGHLPLFSAVRRLVFVSNLSQHTLSFHWDLGSELTQEVLSVQPVSGYIQPGESAACKVTFCSHSSPSLYDLDLLCHVVDESEMLVYQSELKEWDRKQEEKKHLFTVTDKNTTVPKSKKRPQSMSKLKSLPGAQTKKTTKNDRPLTSDNELRGKLSTLPPIGVKEATYDEWKKLDLSVKSKTRPRDKGSSIDEPPVPPEPLLLHLGVKARTSCIPDYTTLECDLERFYIDQQALASGGSSHGVCEPVRAGVEEKQVVENLLLQMTRELLEDANFHTAIKNVTEEPIPYFSQFAFREEPSESIKQSASRHVYAAGLASLPLREDLPLHPTAQPAHVHTPSQSSLSRDVCDVCEDGTVTPQSKHNDSLETEGLEDRTHDQMDTELTSKIKQSSEFTNLVEGILENTLLNILKEASSGETNMTTPIYTIAKAPDDI